MTTNILMPALSPTMEKGTLAKWLIKPGDTVRAGDVIAEIETDKATMEVEAAEDGLVSEILVPAGTEDVEVNTPIARLGEPPAAAPPAEPAQVAAAIEEPAPQPILSPAARRIVEENRLDVAGLERNGRNGRITKGDALAALRAAAAWKIDASPLARKIAQQTGADLSRVRGSGYGGRVLKSDLVERGFPSSAPRPVDRDFRPHPDGPGARQGQNLEQMGIAPGTYDLIPLDGMRKTVARRMTDSFRDVPHFPLTIDLEIDGLLAARTKINALLEKEGVKVSVNDIVMKAAAVALKRVPEANASYTPEGIAMHHHADIAMAVAMPGGLITPIIRKAEAKGLAEIATEAKDVAERARNKKLKPEEYQGGTFSVSNLGMYGIRTFASILNEPQGCILSVGAGEKRPVVRGDKLEIATIMTVTLTCDHRVVDGATGARWLSIFRGLIAAPLTMIT